ncbi:MAG: hypothetical protein EXR13_04005 [Candidatus Fonsibacter sp.]|nr:hypothetical protein [Candidatus Fonsibacter sp.]
MNKKIIISFFASLLFLSQAAKAEIKVGGGSLTFTAGVMSQYIARGIDQNSDRPSPYVSIDFTRAIGIADFYAGIWSAAATGDNFNREENYYAGLKKTLGIATVDLGLNSIRYNSGNRNNNTINSVDGYVKINLAPEKSPFTVGVTYTQNDSGGNVVSGVKKVGEIYQEINATYDAKFAVIGVAYGENKNDTDVTTITLTKSLFDINFVGAYIKADRANTTSSSLTKDREYLTLTASKTF